jgi:FkbM family methyltransferase
LGVSDSSSSRLARFFLRYATPFSGLRRLPVFGPCVRWISSKIVGGETLTWIQVQRGPAAGLWLRVNSRTGRPILAGSVEWTVQQALAEHLHLGMTFYDLGANIGFFTLLAAKLVGPSGCVVSFEADPEIAARLRENISRNSFSWVTVEQKAVWSEPSLVTFLRMDPAISPDRGQGHIIPDAISPNAIPIEAVSLDAYTSNNSAPQFIKCDVEGAEVEVFRGARRLLAEKRPSVLCELHGNETRRIVLQNFSSLGYRCHNCDPTHILALPQ